MRLFWFIRAYMLHIAVVSMVYLTGDQLAATSVALHSERVVTQAKVERSKAEIHQRIAANHHLLKQVGVFDAPVISQTNRGDQGVPVLKSGNRGSD